MTTTVSTSSRATDHDRLLTPPFVRLVVADLAYFTADGVAIYSLPLFVTGPVGSNGAGAGIAFGAFAVSALVLRPFAGRLADVRGRRPLLVGGALLCAVGLGLTALVGTLPLVVALRLLLGVAEAAFFVASLAMLADLAPPSRMGEALSYNSVGLYLGLALGPPLGELLIRTSGFDAAWYAGGALALVAAALAAGIGETRSPQREAATPAKLIHRPAIPAAVGFTTSIVAMGALLTFVSLRAGAVGLAATSLPLLVYGLVVVVTRLVFAKLPDRLPSLPLGAAALATIASGLGLTALSASPAGLVAGTALMGLGVAFSTPAFFTAIFATARPWERGAASGTASACIDLGLGGGPVLIGFVAQGAGMSWALATGALVAAAGSGWTLLLARR